MTYRQYTECVQLQEYKEAPIGNAVAAGLFVAMGEIVIYALATGGLGWVMGGVAAMLFVATTLLSFVHWWLYGRLVCLGGERCTIGMIINVEPSKGKSGWEAFDTDYCFNLLLPPCRVGDDRATVEAQAVAGELISRKTVSLPFQEEGYEGRSCPSDPKTAVLHCECEGAGMYILYQWLKAVIVLLSVAAVLSWFCAVPVVGTILCFIAAVLSIAALISLLAGIFDGQSDEAKPSDVNPELGGELHTNGCEGRGADVLVVSGEWVYDSLHAGWNEIHPVRHCQKIATWEGTWEETWENTKKGLPFDARVVSDEWCRSIAEAGSPLTQENQRKPENQWQIHPDIDGCDPSEVPIIE